MPGMYFNKFLCCLIAFSLLFATDCRALPDTAKIIDGTRVPASSFSNVTPIIFKGDTICTGTLVSKDTVLTAAHCFFNDRNRREVGDKDLQFNFAGQLFQSVEVFINPSYSSRSEACVENEYDAALIKIASPELLPPTIVPASLGRSNPLKGQKLTLVGYGLEGKGQSGEGSSMPPPGLVNYGSTVIERLSSSYIQWDFDPGESNTASGDSGGPSFAEVSGIATLVGITCGGTDNAQFGTESYNTRVDRIVSWIDSVAGSSSNPFPPQYVGRQFMQASTQQYFESKLDFGGSIPDSIQVLGLPDGLTLSDRIISGTPLLAGQYILTVVASNSIGSTTSQITLSVASFNPNLSLQRVLLQFDDLKSKSDFLIVKGRISLPPKFKPKGKKARIQFGRYKRSCKLDSRAGCGTFDYLQLRGKIKRGAFKKNTVNFTIQLINNRLFKALATLGFPETDFASAGEIVALPLEIELNGISYTSTVNLKFRVSDLRWGLSRD